MIQVGAILKEARLKKRLSIEDVEKTTKIRAKFIRGIEENEFESIPSLVYTKGFIKNYADFLGLDSSLILAFFRRQSETPQKSAIIPKGVSEPLNIPVFQLTPGKFIGIILGLCAILFLLYFGLQYRRLSEPPPLVVDKPPVDAMYEERKIDVTGSTNADATITINGISTLVRSDGKFFDQVPLDIGPNKITIVATSRFGKSSTIIRDVGLQLP